MQSQAPYDPFRQDYAARLRELTFNSRPLIQDLSVRAKAQSDQHNWTTMKAVVEEIEAAVLRVCLYLVYYEAFRIALKESSLKLIELIADL